jgi:hypothetical protein
MMSSLSDIGLCPLSFFLSNRCLSMAKHNSPPIAQGFALGIAANADEICLAVVLPVHNQPQSS